jgi:hypothetical protein
VKNVNGGNIVKLVTVADWASITVIAYATLTHVGFVYSVFFQAIADFDATGNEKLSSFCAPHLVCGRWRAF